MRSFEPAQPSLLTGATAAGSLMLGRPFSMCPAKRHAKVASSRLVILRSYQ